MPKFYQRFHKFYLLLGKRGTFLLMAVGVIGLGLAVVEMSLAFSLTLLLKTLGLANDTLHLPWNLQDIFFKSPWALIALLGAIGILRAVLYFLNGQSVYYLQEILSIRLKFLLLEDVSVKPSKLDSLGQVQNFLSEVLPHSMQLCLASSNMLAYFMRFLGLFVVMAYRAPVETFIGFFGIAVGGLMLRYLTIRVNRHMAQAITSQLALAEGITRLVKNWFFLKCLRMLDFEKEEIEGHAVESSMSTLSARMIANGAAVLPQTLGVALVVVLIITQLQFRHLSGEAFLAFLYLFLQMTNALGYLADGFAQFNINFPHLKMAYELFATIEGERRVHALLPSQKLNFFGRRKSASVTQRRTPGVIAPADRLPANTMAPRILGSEITFRYQEADSSLFSGLSFSINPGQQVGILGRSGSGKSTLLAMILGVLRPSKGRIEIDGKAPDQYFADTRTRIGYVGAEPFLIVGTIRDNLLYGGSADRSDSELMEALESAQLGDWARTKTNPLGFVVGERGEGLSTGQCQRLALARAMLMKPDILILDEASANLDEKTETELTEAISRFKGKCTTLIVSHRKGILSNVDSLIQIS